MTNANSPTVVATFNQGVTRSTSVAVKDNYAFFGNGNNGLYVLDINNPSSPNQVYFNQPPGRFVLESALSGNYLYLAAEVSTGLNIIDISTPMSASQVGNFPLSGQTQGIAVNSNYAYLANTGSGLYIVNVSNPASPSQVANIATPGGAYGVAVSGNYAYVASQGAGLHIINISNPANPSIVTTYNTPGSALKVAMQGNYAIVADNTSLQIIDVSNPTTPVLAGRSSIPCISVTVRDNYVYAGCGGLHVFKTIPGPVLTNNQLTVSEGQTVTLSTSNLNATYADVGASSLTYTISNLAGGGRFELSSNLGIAITQFTQQQINSGIVRFTHNGNEVAPSFSVSVSDGLMFTQPSNAAINYTPINDAPVLSSSTTTALTFTEKEVAQVVNPTLTVSDVDSAHLTSATVTIAGYVSGHDVLRLPTNPQNGISANFNTSTGVLTLMGNSSVANYQAALQSITYESSHLALSNRTISFEVNDGELSSNTVTRPISLVPLSHLLSSDSEHHLLCLNQHDNQLLFPQLSIVGEDALTLQQATVAIVNATDEDSLTFTSLNSVTGSYDHNTGILTLTGPAMASEFEATLHTVRYKNSNNITASDTKTITTSVNFNGKSSNSLVSEINLITINDSPKVINPIQDFNVTVGEEFSEIIPYPFDQAEDQLMLSLSGPNTASFNSASNTLNGLFTTEGLNRFSLFGTGACNLTAVNNFSVNAALAPVNEPQGSDYTGTIVGGVIGGIVGLLCLGGILIGGLMARKKQSNAEEETAQTVEMTGNAQKEIDPESQEELDPESQENTARPASSQITPR